MKHLSQMNPSKRKFPGTSPVGSPVRGVTATVRADSEVSGFIWGVSPFLFMFLAMFGGPPVMAIAVFTLPLFASVLVVLSKMGGSRVWAWSMAATHCFVGFLWVLMVAHS